MQRKFKSIAMFGLLIALVAALVAPAAAQDMPANTITVFGSAEAAGTPDQATLELGVDTFTTLEVEELAHGVAERLDADGLTRLRKCDVAPPLPPEWRFRSNLADGPLRIFDALFHWND